MTTGTVTGPGAILQLQVEVALLACGRVTVMVHLIKLELALWGLTQAA